MNIGKIFFSLIVFSIGILPSFAIMDIKITKDYYYDTHSTIMSETEQQKAPANDEFWTRNVFHLGKYRPLFMLSNKELYNLIPQEKMYVSQRIYTPSIYNISLKNCSVSNVSLKPKSIQKPIIEQKPIQKVVQTPVNTNANLISQYEQAKKQTIDIDQKIDVAVLLKNSKIKSNYILAFDLLNDVIASDPYTPYAYCIKAELYVAKNDSDNAIKNYAQALKINPLSKQCCLGLAKVLEPKNKELAKKYYNLAKND